MTVNVELALYRLYLYSSVLLDDPETIELQSRATPDIFGGKKWTQRSYS